MEYDVDSACEILSRTPNVLRALLTGLPPEWLHGREAPDAWSPYQVCGHLLHIEESDWLDRTRIVLEHGTSRPFDPVDREAGFQKYSGWLVEDLLARFAATRESNVAELARLVGPDELVRRGVHPSFGEVSLSELLAAWVVHDFNHLNQVVKTMAKQYVVAVGPWREFLPVLDAP